MAKMEVGGREFLSPSKDFIEMVLLTSFNLNSGRLVLRGRKYKRNTGQNCFHILIQYLMLPDSHQVCSKRF